MRENWAVEGSKQAYPSHFDTLGNFKGVAKLHLKQDCEPFIDLPTQVLHPSQGKAKVRTEEDGEARCHPEGQRTHRLVLAYSVVSLPS